MEVGSGAFSGCRDVVVVGVRDSSLGDLRLRVGEGRREGLGPVGESYWRFCLGPCIRGDAERLSRPADKCAPAY